MGYPQALILDYGRGKDIIRVIIFSSKIRKKKKKKNRDNV